MNRQQRDANRQTNLLLREAIQLCSNCGERGVHWIQTRPITLQDLVDDKKDQGFWICPKYYGTDERRIGAERRRK